MLPLSLMGIEKNSKAFKDLSIEPAKKKQNLAPKDTLNNSK
jgi:hypothetical protein